MRAKRATPWRRAYVLGVAVVAAVATLAWSGNATAQVAEETPVSAYVDGEATRAIDVQGAEPTALSRVFMGAMALGWPTPNNRTYHLQASCQPHAAEIRRGAAAWNGLSETPGSGTPVECRNGYITDCGGGGRIVGCNWGMGQRIALFMGGVNDDALLAAREFGHDWYGHSSYQCAGWGSPQEVMAPSICNYSEKGPRQIRID